MATKMGRDTSLGHQQGHQLGSEDNVASFFGPVPALVQGTVDSASTVHCTIYSVQCTLQWSHRLFTLAILVYIQEKFEQHARKAVKGQSTKPTVTCVLQFYETLNVDKSDKSDKCSRCLASNQSCLGSF